MARVTVDEIATLWSRYGGEIPLTFAIGLAERETNFDSTEVDDYASGKRVAFPEAGGKYTVGLFQVSQSELAEVDGDGSSYVQKLQDLETNVRVFATVTRRRLSTIDALAPRVNPDTWAYLALAHNGGIGMVTKTIQRYGLNWEAFKARNGGTDQGRRWARYGDAAISGGTKWTDSLLDTIDSVADVVDVQDAQAEAVVDSEETQVNMPLVVTTIALSLAVFYIAQVVL